MESNPQKYFVVKLKSAYSSMYDCNVGWRVAVNDKAVGTVIPSFDEALRTRETVMYLLGMLNQL
jgi:hypothetical protein